MSLAQKVPVTVLTGYLGAGKTTLLNRILSESHGKKYAVIVNEFGETGIDGALVVGSEEEIYEMSNGCVCCTVRGDLIRVMAGLLRRAQGFDGILIETTGLADPAPVAQTFFADAEIAAQAQLDSVVTVVDAYHVRDQLKTAPEVADQIAFADSIILNKLDLLDSGAAAYVGAMIQSLNPFARLFRGARGDVPLDQILGQGGFDLDRILAKAPAFLSAEEHHADDCACGCRGARHDTAIDSLSLTAATPLDGAVFESWISGLRDTIGGQLLRYKGILDFAGNPNRIVLQGVHMMIEGGALAPWPENEPRQSRLVFIGRNLDKEALKKGFEMCLA